METEIKDWTFKSGISDCCNSDIYNESGICSECGEHCESAEETKPVTNYNYSNSWTEKPFHVVVCENARHQRYVTRISGSVTEYECMLCNYKFKTDSGD